MNLEPEPSEPPLSVGALTQRLKVLVEGSIGEVWVRGEVSNLRRQSSGHLYFTLKDAEAQLGAVCFRPDAERLASPPREGDAVLAFGRLSVYPPQGKYQLVARLLRPEGEGDLRRRFEALKAKLAAEGLFARGRKRPLPRLPRSLAVITSPTGAALRDFLSILARRDWRGTVRVLPVRVQGSAAAPEIAAALELANRHRLAEVVVLTRGGGSLEDLWPFNEEVVARAVAASALPVISAVGHEIDFSLSDFAADARAETPSAAAELISSEFLEFAESIARHRRQLAQTVFSALERQRYHLRALREGLRAHTPRHRVEQAWLRLDELSARRTRAWERRRAASREAVAHQRLRLAALDPAQRLERARAHLAHLAIRLRQASPEAALKRGYAIVRQGPGEGRLVTRRADLAAGSPVEVEWADGRARLGSTRRAPPAKTAGQLDLDLES
jgi:exodeoxyribonuclease VII large subunit